MEFLLRNLKCASLRAIRNVLKYPKASGLLMCAPLLHFYVRWRAERRLKAPILAALEKGTSPRCLPLTSTWTDRSEVEQKLTQLITGAGRANVDVRSFGVVLGPSGTGKTALTRLVCRRHPVGTIYHEIYDPLSAAEELAKAAGLIISPEYFLDLVLSFASDYYRQYHTLPEDPAKAISYVLDKVSEQAQTFKSKHGYVPTFVIDGVDLVAKEYPQVFVRMVDRAKYLANSGTLRIVFVIGEQCVIPLVDSTSSRTREAPVTEVLDISDEAAEDYLCQSSAMPKNLAKEVVAITGGRFVHLITAIEVAESTVDTAARLDVIKEQLIAQIVRGDLVGVQKQNKSLRLLERAIMSVVVERESVHPERFAKELNVEISQIICAVEHLVSQNFLRYQADRSVTYHSRLIRWCMLNDKLDFGV